MAQTYRRALLRRPRVLLLILLVLVSAAGVWLMGYVGLRATLGQMSVGLSHEFNQPLAAIRSNAENAAELIRMGALDRALEILSRVEGPVDRMGRSLVP